jgi:phosphatidylethanolamine-binding protein (PEBP) family uncharacterized protein
VIAPNGAEREPFRAGRTIHPVPGRRSSRHPVKLAVVAAAVAAALVAGCSNSGRELRAPHPTTIPPSIGTPQLANRSEGVEGFALASPDFEPGGDLPHDAGEDTGNVSPGLAWSGVPAGTAELALVADDGHNGSPYWVVTGIAPSAAAIAAGTAPPGSRLLPNGHGYHGWTGPASPAGDASAPTPVVFTLYALASPFQPAPGDDPVATTRRLANVSVTQSTLTGWFAG